MALVPVLQIETKNFGYLKYKVLSFSYELDYCIYKELLI